MTCGTSINAIEIFGDNTGKFKKTARKHNVDFALKHDRSADPPRWMVFFKYPDVMFFVLRKNGEAYLLTPGDDVIKNLMCSMTGLSSVTAKPLPSLAPSDLLIGLTGASAIYIFVWYRKRNAKKLRKDFEYGSAR